MSRGPAPEAWRTSAFYAAFFAALGVHLPFWPLWLSDWGLSESEIGVYLAAAFAARLAAGVALPILADRRQARRLTLALAAGAGAAAFAAHYWIESRAALFVATLLTAGCLSAITPVGEALGTAAARVYGFAYARARAAGSAAFLAANLTIGGAMAMFGADAALWTVVICLAATAWLGWTHPGGGRVAPGPRPGWDEMRRLAAAPSFRLFALAAGLAQASHAPLYAYGSLHWRALGLDEGTIGALWAFAVAVEIALMTLFGPALVARLKPSGALALSGAVGVVRWALMTLDPTGPALWALQASHALTFAAAHLGAMAFLSAAAPERLAGAGQAVFTVAMGGALMALGTALSAWVYPLAPQAVWWIGAAASAGALAFALGGRRIWDGAEIRV